MSQRPFLYISTDFLTGHSSTIPNLERLTEVHADTVFATRRNGVIADLGAAESTYAGLIIELSSGYPHLRQLLLARRWFRFGKPVFFYWPAERLVERIDDSRIRRYFKLLITVAVGGRLLGVSRRVNALGLLRRALGPTATAVVGPNWARESINSLLSNVEQLGLQSRPASLRKRMHDEKERWRILGHGVYLRTDYWAKIEAGGSYGHTCYVAKELSEVSEKFTAFMAHRYELLDELGVRQILIRPSFTETDDDSLLRAGQWFYVSLRAAIEALSPAYVYERAVLGNFAGAQLSSDLGIPYLLEYNGSEISMNKSFGSGSYRREADFLKIEVAAFKQATVVSVISERVREDLVARGVDPSKILVNPNGVDFTAYRPPSADEKLVVRNSLGFRPDDRVIGFIGTFGAWHGIDTLAAALPLICERVPQARFLLIGDGNTKYLIDEVVKRNRLWERVLCTGSVTQQEGARLLRACDVLVSPHNTHMIDSRFFGSPTKLFEYMAMGAGIVASDLEQIGEVLSPAVRADRLDRCMEVRSERAILCRPGDLQEFVAAVVFLCEYPNFCEALGRNARRAAVDGFGWHDHVQRLLAFAANVASDASSAVAGVEAELAARPMLETSDSFKDEAQRQWNNDPCGSHYAPHESPYTLEWYLAIERHRYQEYAPWMPALMEFDQYRHKDVLEIGAGLGTDLAQFARHGANVTDLDLSSAHLARARENFELRGLRGRFFHHDAESLPFPDASFDVVYCNGVLHHTPNTQGAINEIFRVLRPGGRVIAMVYAENSLNYWRNVVGYQGLIRGRIHNWSIWRIMSESVEIGSSGARPLVKVYTASKLRKMFDRFSNIKVYKRQLTADETPLMLRWLPLWLLERFFGWNLIIKGTKRV